MADNPMTGVQEAVRTLTEYSNQRTNEARKVNRDTLEFLVDLNFTANSSAAYQNAMTLEDVGGGDGEGAPIIGLNTVYRLAKEDINIIQDEDIRNKAHLRNEKTYQEGLDRIERQDASVSAPFKAKEAGDKHLAFLINRSSSIIDKDHNAVVGKSGDDFIKTHRLDEASQVEDHKNAMGSVMKHLHANGYGARTIEIYRKNIDDQVANAQALHSREMLANRETALNKKDSAEKGYRDGDIAFDEADALLAIKINKFYESLPDWTKKSIEIRRKDIIDQKAQYNSKMNTVNTYNAITEGEKLYRMAFVKDTDSEEVKKATREKVDAQEKALMANGNSAGVEYYHNKVNSSTFDKSLDLIVQNYASGIATVEEAVGEITSKTYGSKRDYYLNFLNAEKTKVDKSVQNLSFPSDISGNRKFMAAYNSGNRDANMINDDRLEDFKAYAVNEYLKSALEKDRHLFALGVEGYKVLKYKSNNYQAEASRDYEILESNKKREMEAVVVNQPEVFYSNMGSRISELTSKFMSSETSLTPEEFAELKLLKRYRSTSSYVEWYGGKTTKMKHTKR